MMLRLGLTGGIATGKSAVAAMLRELRFDVLDADSLARQFIEPGQPAYDEVLREFARQFLMQTSASIAPTSPPSFSLIPQS